MSTFQSFRDRMSVTGESFVDTKSRYLNALLSSKFRDDPSYEDVRINGANVGSRIVSDTKVATKKKIYVEPTYSIKGGDLVERPDGTKWLCLTYDKKETSIGFIEKCNSTLSWVDSNGIVRSYPCIYYFNTRSNFGVDDDRIMSLPDGRRQVAVQRNEHTIKLARNNRFLFDGQAFKVIDYDYTSDEGLVNLSLQETEINPATDNVELNIADYYGKAATDPEQSPEPDEPNGEYSIEIKSSSTLSNEIKYNQSKTFIVSVTDTNGDIVSDAEILFELYASDQASSTTKAIITSTEGQSCLIKNNATNDNSYVWLKASLDEDTYIWHRIQLKPLF